MYVPRPLGVRFSGSDPSVEDIAIEILVPSKLNWNCVRLDARKPITLLTATGSRPGPAPLPENVTRAARSAYDMSPDASRSATSGTNLGVDRCGWRYRRMIKSTVDH